MRNLSISFLAFLGFVSFLPLAKASDRADIQQVIENYFEGYQQANVDLIQSAFHPSVRLLSVENGKLDITLMEDWLKGLTDRHTAGDVRKGTLEIRSIEISDYAAAVKLEIGLEKFQFTDFLSLLKLEGKWVIVGKIYHFQLR